MCYSGKCRWEGYMGDCAFPHNKKVREKYPLPLCDIPEDEAEQEFLNDAYEDIQEILRQEKMKNKIKQLVKPENGIEIAIIADADFIEGASYGKPRSGHPEGKVIYHIKEVLDNIDKFYADDPDREDLRFIALTHDTFKHKVDKTQPKTGANHHGSIARVFAQKFTQDHKVLNIIERHDEAYNSWGVGSRRGKWFKAEERANRLIQGLLVDGGLGLYIKFYKCDNLTGDKEQENYEWFINLIK